MREEIEDQWVDVDDADENIVKTDTHENVEDDLEEDGSRWTIGYIIWLFFEFACFWPVLEFLLETWTNY